MPEPTIEELKKENEQLKKQIAEINSTPEVTAFYALRKMLIKQTTRIDKFDLDKEIGLNPKDDKVYDRTMDIVVKMPKMISELNTLKAELKLTGKQDVDEAPFIETIARDRK